MHVALVGCGRWGRHVLRDLLALGCQVTVVARSERGRESAREGNASAIVAEVAELGEVDGVVVVTPTTTHAEVLAEVLPLGVPVYVEKPLTTDPDSARSLVEDAGERIFVMHKWRYHGGVRELATIARRQELGPVRGLRTTRVGWGNPHGDVDGVWMLAPHDMSIALEILGELQEPRSCVLERSGGMVSGLFGVLGSGEGPWMATDVSIASPVRRREVRLICEDGVAVLADAYAESLLIARGELQRDVTREDEQRPFDQTMPLLAELRAFVGHLAGGPPPLSSAAEGLAEVEAIAGLRALAEEGLHVS